MDTSMSVDDKISTVKLALVELHKLIGITDSRSAGSTLSSNSCTDDFISNVLTQLNIINRIILLIF